MTNHDIQLLTLGITAGMDLMLLIHMAFGLLDDHRDRKALRSAQAKPTTSQERAAA